MRTHINADGKYSLDDVTRRQLEADGQDVKTYIKGQQARYEMLLAEGVGSWIAEKVKRYTDGIQQSSESIYGNAALSKDDLSKDDFLTKDEKVEVLVGSAKSAKDLLITFAPGSIKEGITDTNTTLKGTPHVSGKAVTLTAGEAQGSIGQKKDGMTIDLSDMTRLTREQLLALSAAERGDFTVVNGNTVKVSSIRAIDAEAKGKLQATADKGAIYLVTEGSIAGDSTFKAGDEIRLKAADNVAGVTLTSDKQIILESGEGAIHEAKLAGKGVLTARAKVGVSLKKSDGDLVINTIYASEGDVRLDVGGNSLLAEDGHDTSGDETGTTYTNVEGKNITITNAKNIKGASGGASLGMKVIGTKAKDGSETPGVITAHAKGDADITLFGKAASEAIDIDAEDLTLTSRGDISDGSYKARKALRVHTAQNNTISGGNFSGGIADITNAGKMSGGVYTAEGDLTYTDSENASLSGSDFTSKEGNVKVTAKGQLALKKLGAKESATVEADHDVTLTEAEAGMLAISSGGSVNAGMLTATTGDAKVTAKTDVKIGTLKAEAGNATIEATAGKLGVTTLNAKEHAALTSGGAMTLESASADTLTANAGTTLDATKIHTTGDAGLASGSDMVLHEAKAGGKLTADAGGSISVKGTDAKISGSAIEMTAKKDIRITDRSLVGKLDGVDTSTPAGSTTGSGAAGSLVTGEVKPHDFDASGKGSALLSSAGGRSHSLRRRWKSTRWQMAKAMRRISRSLRTTSVSMISQASARSMSPSTAQMARARRTTQAFTPRLRVVLL